MCSGTVFEIKGSIWFSSLPMCTLDLSQSLNHSARHAPLSILLWQLDFMDINVISIRSMGIPYIRNVVVNFEKNSIFASIYNYLQNKKSFVSSQLILFNSILWLLVYFSITYTCSLILISWHFFNFHILNIRIFWTVGAIACKNASWLYCRPSHNEDYYHEIWLIELTASFSLNQVLG